MIYASFNPGGDLQGLANTIATVAIGLFVFLIIFVIFGMRHIVRTRKRKRMEAQKAVKIINEAGK